MNGVFQVERRFPLCIEALAVLLRPYYSEVRLLDLTSIEYQIYTILYSGSTAQHIPFSSINMNTDQPTSTD